MPRLRRLLPLVPCLALFAAFHVPAAGASTTQQAIFEDDAQLHANLDGTLQTIKSLGASRIRVFVRWGEIAPGATSTTAPHGFNATNPGSYPAGNWAFYDSVVRGAQQYGLGIDFMLTSPAPRWAEGGNPAGSKAGTYKPNARAFGQFARAIGTRYDGSYTPSGQSSPLPKVSFWTVWNEPNYGQDLSPEGLDHGRYTYAADDYRLLADAAWSGLRGTGHTGDTILFGETAPHGNDPIASGGALYDPLKFIRGVYCVAQNNRPLTGSLARLNGCPASAAARRRFRAQNQILFDASGFAAHLYAQSYTSLVPPNKTIGNDPNYADLGTVSHLTALLDKLNTVYGSHKRFAIYNTEYGFQTNPPQNTVVLTPAEAAAYDNQAEYISYKNPRIVSFAQYLLRDPAGPNGDDFASGLEFSDGTPKPGYAAYELPLYMPSTSTTSGGTLEIWGAVRPAHSMPGQTAQIQFAPTGSSNYTTVQTVPITSSQGYFDVQHSFTQSGTVRLAWSGTTMTSRTIAVTVK